MLALAPARRAGLTVPSLGPVQGCVSFVKEVRLARGELANVMLLHGRLNIRRSLLYVYDVIMRLYVIASERDRRSGGFAA